MTHVLCVISAIALFWMMIQVTLDSIMRYAFSSPIHGTVEVISAYSMLMVVYLPLAYVSRVGAHMEAAIFTQRLPLPAMLGLQRAVYVLCIGVLMVLVWMTALEAVWRTDQGETWDAGNFLVEVWPSRWIPPIGSAAMAIYLLHALLTGRLARKTGGASGRGTE
jgi:TRAP-type C4-dicarboxylate transport system permease small subunit